MTAKRRVVLVVVLGLAVLVVLRVCRRPGLYRVVILPSLGGGSTRANAFNDRGQVVGFSRTADGDYHLFLWSRGRGIEDLGDIGGSQPPGCLHINNAGQIAGTKRVPDRVWQAFVRDPNGAMWLLDTPGGSVSDVAGLNNGGQIAGTYVTADDSRHVFFWDKTNGLRDVVASSNSNGHVQTINDAGLVWGSVDTPAQTSQPFIWDPNEGLMPAPSRLPGGEHYLHDLNNRSCFLTVHRFKPTQGPCLALWHPQTGYTKLRRPEGYVSAGYPALVNDVNQVVFEEVREKLLHLQLFGRTLFYRPSRETEWVLYDPARGRIVLDTYLPWGLRKHFVVCDINNSGAILGRSVRRNKRNVAILLEPVPEKWQR